MSRPLVAATVQHTTRKVIASPMNTVLARVKSGTIHVRPSNRSCSKHSSPAFAFRFQRGGGHSLVDTWDEFLAKVTDEFVLRRIHIQPIAVGNSNSHPVGIPVFAEGFEFRFDEGRAGR